MPRSNVLVYRESVADAADANVTDMDELTGKKIKEITISVGAAGWELDLTQSFTEILKVLGGSDTVVTIDDVLVLEAPENNSFEFTSPTGWKLTNNSGGTSQVVILFDEEL